MSRRGGKANPTGEVIERDLAAAAIPLITDEWVQGVYTDPSKLTAVQRQALSASDAFIDELVAADTIVIGAPMYNFTVSSTLKAWIDQVVRLGKTFVYGPNGRKGLLSGKRVVVITSRGGVYTRGAAAAQFDFQEPYLPQILGFMGIADVTFIHADSQARPELAELSRAAALERIRQIAVQTPAALQPIPS